MHAIARVVVLLAAAAAFTHAAAQEIVIGHVCGYTGPARNDANEMGAGAQALLDAVNARGGFNGKKFRLFAVDDEFKPDNTVRLVDEMKGKAIALLPITGSANGAALVKANNLAMPLVGTIPAPDIMREWPNPNVFHIRASDREQAEAILQQQVTIGLTKIALLVPNNPSGEQLTKLTEDFLAKRALKLAANAVYLLAGPKVDLEPGLKALQGKDFQAVIIFGPPPIIAAAIKAVKGAGVTAQLYAMSYADAQLISKVAGPQYAHGVAISQVMPNINNKTLKLVKEFHEDFAKYAKAKDIKTAPTFFNLEGYVSARLIVDAVRRSKDASPAGVRKGLEMMKEYDLGGYTVDFSPSKHWGSQFVELSLIGASGRLAY
ncbi:MAG TPA: ABC transporter substrate-binding protein [Burkholderiales bacterium]|nr:ABC transporter substrate-binding protein [Burkholderiales bacterium]